MQSTIKNRTIFCRDNLEILRGINSNSIDLIYLDPPFNKKKTFHAPIGSSAEGAAFSDIFRQKDVKDEWLETITQDHYSIHELLNAVNNIEGRTSFNFCYLAYMAIRLIECHRVLKDTGSLYLHCDPTMSHYLKSLMDCIFSEKNFRNEIVWCYSNSGRNKNKFSTKHDIVLFYSKSINYYWDYRIELSEKYIESHYKQTDNQGRKCRIRIDAGKERIYYPSDGMTCNDWWDDIPSLNSVSKTRTGYPTQKPLDLLERIITASSNSGDTVLDPFCGCATTCVAAERLGRQWVGIDISHKAYDLVKQRLDKEVNKPDLELFYEELVNYSVDAPIRTDEGKGVKDAKYVYVISNPKYDGEYKVGIAHNCTNRLNAYQTGDPNRGYKLEYKIHTENYREIEKYIHDKFDNNHEWVRAKLEDIIKEIEDYAPPEK